MKRRPSTRSSAVEFEVHGEAFVIEARSRGEECGSIVTFFAFRQVRGRQREMPEYRVVCHSPLLPDSRELAQVNAKGLWRMKAMLSDLATKRWW